MHVSPDVSEMDNASMPGASRFGRIVGASRALGHVLDQIDQVASTDATVLITGESGTGKDSKHAASLACPDDGLSAFLCARPRLFGIAYRMLGSAAEAEDVVQDVWVRWQTADRSAVRNPLAFLVTATTRLAINVLQSARVRRETAVGEWLPEPVDASNDPELGTELREALNLAVQILLEKLSPTERAAYVLREAFSYPYRKIADILWVEEANARQLVTRAREHVSSGRRAPVSPTEQRCLLEAFVAAARTGDLARLQRLFASDVRATSDGAYRCAPRLPVVRRNRGARCIAALAGHFRSGATVSCLEANGQMRARIQRPGKRSPWLP